MKNKFLPYFLLFIFLLAFWLRLYRIDALPLYPDETGHYWLYHLILEKAPKLTTWLYNQTYNRLFSFTWLFGLTPLGVRFASMLYGSLTVVTSFFFAYIAGKRKSTAFLTSLLIAVSPWAYMISRLGHTHVSIVVFLSTVHVFFFLRAKKLKDYFVSLLFLMLTLLYYPSIVVIAPPAAILVIWYAAKIMTGKQKRKVTIAGVIATIFLIPFIINRFQIFNLSARGLDLAIWRDVNTPYDTDKARALSWNSQPSLFSFTLPGEQLANKLFLNRVTANFNVFTRNYLSFFTPDWLFLGGDPILRHSTGMVGAFYLFLLPFMFYGAFKFFSHADKKTKLTFLVWILASPIPAAITKDGAGYLLRVATMLPFLTYYAALGIDQSFTLFSKKVRPIYALILSVVALYSIWSFFYGYFHVYPALSARSYEYGFKELSDFQVKNGSKTMLILWNGYYPYNEFLFWQQISFSESSLTKITPIGIGETTFWKTRPNLFFGEPKTTEDVSEFVKRYQPAFLALPDRFFAKYDDELLELTKEKITQIKYPDQTTAFSIYTVK